MHMRSVNFPNIVHDYISIFIRFSWNSKGTWFPGGASGKEPSCQCKRQKRYGFNPWVGKSPWRRTWQPTPVFLPGECHGHFLVAQTVKRLSTMRETWVPSLGREDPLEKEMAIHSSTIAWKIPWTEEPGRLQSMGSQRVGHDWTTSLSFPLPYTVF